jgi:hypothetical protein
MSLQGTEFMRWLHRQCPVIRVALDIGPLVMDTER